MSGSGRCASRLRGDAVVCGNVICALTKADDWAGALAMFVTQGRIAWDTIAANNALGACEAWVQILLPCMA